MLTEQPVSADRRIAAARSGASRETECRLDGAPRELALWLPLAAYAADMSLRIVGRRSWCPQASSRSRPTEV